MYKARKKVGSTTELEEVLQDIPESSNYRITGSMIIGIHPGSRKNYREDEAIRFFEQEPYSHITMTAVYDEEPYLNLRGQIGPLPTVSMKGELSVGSFEQFRNFLDGEDWK